MSAEIVVVLITVFGGLAATILLELFKRLLGRARDRSGQDSRLRNELRAEAERAKDQLDEIRAEIKASEKEADKWRSDYWSLFNSYNNLRALLDKVDAEQMTVAQLRARIPNQAPHEVRLEEGHSFDK
jgi:uncharacterized coiled-coil DUF342 family protein